MQYDFFKIAVLSCIVKAKKKIRITAYKEKRMQVETVASVVLKCHRNQKLKSCGTCAK